jgi:hypothetical protein
MRSNALGSGITMVPSSQRISLDCSSNILVSCRMKAVVALPLPSTMVDPGGSPSLLPRSAALRLRGEGASYTSLPRTPFTVSRKGAAPEPAAATSKTLFSSLLFGCRRIQLLFTLRFVTITDASASSGAVPEGSARFFWFWGRGGAAHGHTTGSFWCRYLDDSGRRAAPRDDRTQGTLLKTPRSEARSPREPWHGCTPSTRPRGAT